MLVSYPFTLKNISYADLFGIILDLSACTLPLKHCTVIRERGTLSYEEPLTSIQLGNFYPEESCSLILTLATDTELLDPIALTNCLSATHLTGTPPTLTPLSPIELPPYLLLTPTLSRVSLL